MSARRRATRASARPGRGRRRAEGARELGADRLDHLVEDDADVAAAIVELVEDGDAGHSIAGDQRGDEPIDGLGLGQAEQVADAGLVDPAAGRREQLVEHRLGVAHPAGGEPGDEVDRGRLGSIDSASRIRSSLPSISGIVRRRTS